MKKITMGLMVIAVMAVLAFGLAYAVSDNDNLKPCDNSNGPVSGNGIGSASSILNRCVPPSICGDLVCSSGETPTSCPLDCYCGDLVCSSGETPTSCPADCQGSG